MFRKLHIHMTLFSTFITGTILVLLASACLIITESNIRQKHYTVFTNNAYSCVSHLESQNVLSHRWIQQAESNYGIDMQIYDGNTPLFLSSSTARTTCGRSLIWQKKSLQKITD